MRGACTCKSPAYFDFAIFVNVLNDRPVVELVVRVDARADVTGSPLELLVRRLRVSVKHLQMEHELPQERLLCNQAIIAYIL